MTDQTNADLIAASETWTPAEVHASPVGAARIIESLAAALEAAEQRAEEAERRLNNMRYLATVYGKAWDEERDRAEAAEERAKEAERERDRLDEAFDRDLPWRYDEVEAQRNQLAAALADAEQRADLADADLEVEQQKNAGYRSRNDALAAVVEKVRAVMAETCCGDDEMCEHDDHVWADYYGEKVADISILLATVPADILREVKAEAHDQGYRQAWRDVTGVEHTEYIPSQYRAREE